MSLRFPLVLKPDAHSCYKLLQPKITHLEWEVEIDFPTKALRCVARLTFDSSGEVDLDTWHLDIDEVANAYGERHAHTIGLADKVLGSTLHAIVGDDRTLVITYTTSPNATGLHWLEPEQTAGGRHPFLYTQAQCIQARTFLPCQDTPGVRFPFTARVTLPVHLTCVMGAVLTDSVEVGDQRTVTFEQQIAVPSYLVALAAGALDVRKLSDRSSVFAEAPLIERAAREFEDVESYIKAGERLFGEYLWGEFNIVIMPLAFPFGGMENPGATFLSPSCVPGDGSQVDVVAHELAHHWTGNWVVNANWDHFWLNESWTSWAQFALTEAVEGKETSRLQAALVEVELRRDLERFEGQPWMTRLATEQHGVDPLEQFNRVPYMKGCFLLMRIQEVFGTRAFMAFVKAYIESFGGESIDSETFIEFLFEHFDPDRLVTEVSPWRWIYGTGMPDTTPAIESELLNSIVSYAKAGLPPDSDTAKTWNGAAWTYYLSQVPRDSASLCVQLGSEFGLDTTTNADVRCEWFLLGLSSGALVNWAGLKQFLAQNGRVKHLVPLYGGMVKANPHSALGVYAELKDRYHGMAVMMLDKVMPTTIPATAVVA